MSRNYYEEHATALADRYASLDANAIHQGWRHLLDDSTPGLACDIGAGSGRDAKWLASLGWEVVAVEPAEQMRKRGQQYTEKTSVTWLDDSLPSLRKLREIGYRFDLIVLSAVWQHTKPTERERMLRILSDLLKPNGMLVISIRQTSLQEALERGFYEVSSSEVSSLAAHRALVEVANYDQPDMSRRDLSWRVLVFRLPDDGTGSLALLRHIIVNDSKSASYKLGLIRVLSRIAETLPGAVINRTRRWVEIPLGLVGLLWIKQYRRLIVDYGLQVGTSKGIAFATDAFYQVAGWSDYDLHIGSSIAADRGKALTLAIRDACDTILRMPTNYISYPGTTRQIFDGDRFRVRAIERAVRIDREYLAAFGVYRVPVDIWRSLGDYACWVEPSLINEWVNFSRSREVREGAQISAETFALERPLRFTGEAKARLEALNAHEWRVRCTWSQKASRSLDIDHCFPWARWHNNDLWNLLPASREVNASKSDKLPTLQMFATAREPILEWWANAYLDTRLEGRFFEEANTALPAIGDTARTNNVESLYTAMLHQRTRIKANQRLADWEWPKAR